MRLVWLGASVPLLLLFCTASNAQPRREGDTQTVTGVVKEMTAAPKGEVDGAVLDDGTVIHWPPHLADRFTGIVARGDRIRVIGWMETGPRGDTKLEVRTVTNLRTNAARQNDDEPPPPPRGRRPAPPPPPPDLQREAPDRPGDTELRIRDLETQIEQLRKEIERLRREK